MNGDGDILLEEFLGVIVGFIKMDFKILYGCLDKNGMGIVLFEILLFIGFICRCYCNLYIGMLMFLRWLGNWYWGVYLCRF